MSTVVGRLPAEIGLRRLLLAAEAAASCSIMSVMSSGLIELCRAIGSMGTLAARWPAGGNAASLSLSWSSSSAATRRLAGCGLAPNRLLLGNRDPNDEVNDEAAAGVMFPGEARPGVPGDAIGKKKGRRGVWLGDMGPTSSTGCSSRSSRCGSGRGLRPPNGEAHPRVAEGRLRLASDDDGSKGAVARRSPRGAVAAVELLDARMAVLGLSQRRSTFVMPAPARTSLTRCRISASSLA
jgi:hypothetical protein